MSAVTRARVTTRGISRLCHFTPSRNLMHIATDPNGLLSSARLREDEKAVLNATDVQRLDGFPDHVSLLHPVSERLVLPKSATKRRASSSTGSCCF